MRKMQENGWTVHVSIDTLGNVGCHLYVSKGPKWSLTKSALGTFVSRKFKPQFSLSHFQT